MAGLVISQIAAYGMVAFLLFRIIIPELKALRKNPFLSYGKSWALRKKYLVAYGILNAVASVAIFIILTEQAFQNLSLFTSLIIAICGFVPLVAAVLVLLQWILDFYRAGNCGLFQDLYLSGSRVQDAVLPFLWILFVIDVCLSLISDVAIEIGLWVAGESSIFSVLVSMPASIADSFAFLALFFYLGMMGLGMGRMVLSYLGLVLAFMATQAASAKFFSLFSGYSIKSGFFAMANQEPLRYDVLFDASGAIIATLIGLFLYKPLVQADPRRWFEKDV